MADIPERIGRYEVLHQLGQGGMGVLYLARDPVIDRHVALKLLKVDNDDLRRRFVREARSAGRLQHPNIVTVYDVGDQDGELFIAMEYIDGDTLSSLIREDVPFSTLRKLELLDQLADGLGFAHQRGIIHRDIKPANLMVTRGGLLKVLDFGIARIAHSQPGALSLAPGSLIGTPAYMAPEQLEGEPVDHRADIFAVGLVMYELLSGRRAFGGATTADVLENVMRAEPEPLPGLVPGIDPDLVACVTRALAKRPDARYQDLQELRHDLGRVRRRFELQSGAFDATMVVQAPAPTRPVSVPASTDETIVAPVAAVPALPVSAVSGTAAPAPPSSPARRRLLPALIAVGVVVLMLAASVLAGLWWVRTRLLERFAEPASTEARADSSGVSPALEAPAEEPSTAAATPAEPDVSALQSPASPAASAQAAAPLAEITPGAAAPVARTPAAGGSAPVGPRAATASPPATAAAARDVERTALRPPAPTAAPPAASQEPSATADTARDDALALVRAYVAARNSAHTEGLRRVWPSVTEVELRRMTGAFSAPLTLTGCEMQAAASDTMRATCRFTQPGSTDFSQGTTLNIRRQLVFDFERQGRTWLIAGVTG